MENVRTSPYLLVPSPESCLFSPSALSPYLPPGLHFSGSLKDAWTPRVTPVFRFLSNAHISPFIVWCEEGRD